MRDAPQFSEKPKYVEAYRFRRDKDSGGRVCVCVCGGGASLPGFNGATLDSSNYDGGNKQIEIPTQEVRIKGSFFERERAISNNA